MSCSGRKLGCSAKLTSGGPAGMSVECHRRGESVTDDPSRDEGYPHYLISPGFFASVSGNELIPIVVASSIVFSGCLLQISTTV